MKKFLFCTFAALAAFFGAASVSCSTKTDYVVLQSQAVADDPDWAAVTAALAEKHGARVCVFAEYPAEALDFLRENRPRFVAIVELPERLNRDYIIEAHALSRRLDDDIYADYLWGVISGYDSANAMRMVAQTVEPMVVNSAVATITETADARWFDRYGWVDDRTPGLWGEKTGPGQPVVRDTIDPRRVLQKFTDLYEAIDPDLVLTAAHATQRNLEMPFSLGNLRPGGEKCLYADDRIDRGRWADTTRVANNRLLSCSEKRKVYFAVGNCLIGDFAGSAQTMAPTWISGQSALIMSGYVVTTWHGRNGWGGLKYWLTTPGRYTLAEAIYLNQQDFLHQFSLAAPALVAEPFDYEEYLNDAGDDIDLKSATVRRLKEATNGSGPVSSSDGTGDVAPTDGVVGQHVQPLGEYDLLGFWHDRDVLAFYGDPKWDVRLQQIPAENDFSVRFETDSRFGRVRRAKITVETSPTFDPARMAGGGFKQEHVLDLPFSCFFPERLMNPRLAPGQVRPDGQPWQVAVAEDFMFVYNHNFEPGKKYTFILDVGR